MNVKITSFPVFGQVFSDDLPLTFLAGLVKFFSASVSFLLLAALVGGLVYLIHFFFTLPMRREERARLFLDLVEGALNRGQSIEEMILSVAASHDRTVGVRFYFLAAHIESD